MGRDLPAKVSPGQQLSAAWLNSVVDYLRYLNEQQLRRKILRGTGYAARETAGGTTLSIDRQPYTRVCEDGLDILRNEDFLIRIKPKSLCEVDEDGNWDKTVQVHSGKITDHQGREIEVKELFADPSAGQQKSTPEPGGGDDSELKSWDAKEWVDIGTLSLKDDGASSVNIFVRVPGFFPAEAKFTSTKPEEPDGNHYIPIGRVRIAANGEMPRIYISQFQRGPIELGGGGKMPFDVSLVSVSVPNPDGEQFAPVSKDCLRIEGGRVFLSDARYSIIPPKEPSDSGENLLTPSAGYLMLSLCYSSTGALTYKYTIEPRLPGTAVTPQELT